VPVRLLMREWRMRIYVLMSAACSKTQKLTFRRTQRGISGTTPRQHVYRSP
jgi:hypothetical protein